MEPAGRPRPAAEPRPARQEVRRHHDAAEHDEVRAELRRGRQDLQATVGQGSFLTLRLDGRIVTRLPAGKYTVAVVDRSAKDNFHLVGGSVNRATSVAKRQNATWILDLKKGVYRYSSDGSARRKAAFRVA